jgi:hypothetical protein
MSKQTTVHTPASRKHVGVIIAVVTVVALAVAWAGGVLFMRAGSNPERLSDSLGQDLSVVRDDDLVDRIGTQGSFPAWKLSKGSEYAGSIYMLTLETTDPTLLQRVFLAPRTLQIAVSVDPGYFVKDVSPILPSHPGLPTAFFEQWEGSNLYQLIGTDETELYDAGGDLAGPMRQAMRNLASSAYVRDLGEDAFNRLVAQRQSPGLTLRKPFPVFRATTVGGQQISLTDLRGKTTAIVYTEPSCGSCYQATMDVINAVRDRKLDWNIVAVIQGERGVAPVDRYVQEATDRGAFVIIDPDQSVAKQMRQTQAPYAVLLDAETNVRYTGDAYTGVYELIDELSRATVP